VKLFGQLVRTVVNVAILPAELARDVVDPTLSGKGHTAKALDRLKREAAEQKRTEP
jgi:hypothetical protein